MNIIKLKRTSYISMQYRNKFESCAEHRQIGYLCDSHPTCEGCSFVIPDNVYKMLGGSVKGELVWY